LLSQILATSLNYDYFIGDGEGSVAQILANPRPPGCTAAPSPCTSSPVSSSVNKNHFNA